jgi:transcriptional regulator with XRE-family HTH domain
VSRSQSRRLPADSAAAAITEILRRSGLSQAELARRAGLTRSVLNAYLHGSREPGADTLMRLAAAGGMGFDLVERRPPVDPQRADRILVQVLELAEELPYRPQAETRYPPLTQRLGQGDSPP